MLKLKKPYGLEQNKQIARKGGNIAKNAKESIEEEIGQSVISKENTLDYQYSKDKELMDVSN